MGTFQPSKSWVIIKSMPSHWLNIYCRTFQMCLFSLFLLIWLNKFLPLFKYKVRLSAMDHMRYLWSAWSSPNSDKEIISCSAARIDSRRHSVTRKSKNHSMPAINYIIITLLYSANGISITSWFPQSMPYQHGIPSSF